MTKPSDEWGWKVDGEFMPDLKERHYLYANLDGVGVWVPCPEKEYSYYVRQLIKGNEPTISIEFTADEYDASGKWTDIPAKSSFHAKIINAGEKLKQFKEWAGDTYD